MAAGGLVTTPEDTARFVIELMRAWQGRSPLLLPDGRSPTLTWRGSFGEFTATRQP